jgi:hypothetical protein
MTTQHNYTMEQVYEIKHCMDDPIHFIKTYCKLPHPIHYIVPFELTDNQVDAINTFNEDKSCLLLSSRQKGKTNITIAYLIWYSIFHNYHTVCIVAPSLRRLFDLRVVFDFMFKEMPDWIKHSATHYNKHSINLSNGTNILFCSMLDTTIFRGHTINVIWMDDLSDVKYGIQESVYASLIPALMSTKGKLLVTTTPQPELCPDLVLELWNGDTNTFFNKITLD